LQTAIAVDTNEAAPLTVISLRTTFVCKVPMFWAAAAPESVSQTELSWLCLVLNQPISLSLSLYVSSLIKEVGLGLKLVYWIDYKFHSLLNEWQPFCFLILAWKI
jgi:hypothetical protein